MTALQFPVHIAVGKVSWEDPREPNGFGHRLAVGAVEVPDGTAVCLKVNPVDRAGGRRKPPRVQRRRGVDLEFVRSLPPDSVSELSIGNVAPDSFAAVAHLAPGLRTLDLYIDNLGRDAASVIAKLRALESLTLYGDQDGRGQLDDHALAEIANLPALDYLALLDGSYTEHGLKQLARLPRLRHLHIEKEGLTAPMFRFAAKMPALTTLTGLDEFGDDGPMPPAEVARVQAMIPHISFG